MSRPHETGSRSDIQLKGSRTFDSFDGARLVGTILVDGVPFHSGQALYLRASFKSYPPSVNQQLLLLLGTTYCTSMLQFTATPECPS